MRSLVLKLQFENQRNELFFLWASELGGNQTRIDLGGRGSCRAALDTR